MPHESKPAPESNRQSIVKTGLRRVLGPGIYLICALIWLWCIGFAYCLDDNWPNWIAHLLALAIAIGIPFLHFRFRRTRKHIALIALVVVFGCSLAGFYAIKPTHDRDWGSAQAKLPQVVVFPTMFGGTGTESVFVSNIRANRYGPVALDGDSFYEDQYDLSKLESVWFGVDRFTDVRPLAHSFLSFGFEPGTHRANYLTFSVETRREADELTYSPIRGLFRNYEIIYVIADEQDLLSGRSDLRENPIQLYPVRATKEQIRAMFLDMADRTNSIHEQPEFYHTLTSNCTNNIVYHTNNVLDDPISAWERGVIFPGYSDWLAYRLGIIDTELPLSEARERFRIDKKVKEYDGSSDFSDFIRGR